MITTANSSHPRSYSNMVIPFPTLTLLLPTPTLILPNPDSNSNEAQHQLFITLIQPQSQLSPNLIPTLSLTLPNATSSFSRHQLEIILSPTLTLPNHSRTPPTQIPANPHYSAISY